MDREVGREEELGHSDIEAALATRRELGARYDAELVDGFAERIERAVERRVAEQVDLQRARTATSKRGAEHQLALGVVSLVAFIPISIVLGLNDHLVALLLALVGIVAVNAAHAWQSRGG